MSADQPETDAEDTAPAPKPKSHALLVGIVLLLCAGGAATAWYLGVFGGTEATEEGGGDTETQAAPIYFTLADNLVVNFRSAGGVRYLQIGIDLMTYDHEAIEAFELHAPVLRNNLILLLSDQDQDDLATREGKEVVRELALAEVRSVMQELHGSPLIEALYFTTFVMQ